MIVRVFASSHPKNDCRRKGASQLARFRRPEWPTDVSDRPHMAITAALRVPMSTSSLAVTSSAPANSKSKTPTQLTKCCLAGRLAPNNIPEDTFCPLLISGIPNCLPGCWAREDNKQENFNNNMLVKNPVWNGGGPVQCCGGAYGRGVRPSGLPPPPPILLYMLNGGSGPLMLH